MSRKPGRYGYISHLSGALKPDKQRYDRYDRYTALIAELLARIYGAAALTGGAIHKVNVPTTRSTKQRQEGLRKLPEGRSF